MKVSSLHIYPIKGVRGVSLDAANVEWRGLDGDRRWLIITQDDRFVTQREIASLATIIAEPIENGLRLKTDADQGIVAPFPSPDHRADVTVWRSVVNAAIHDGEAAAWLSDILGAKLRLAYMDDEAERLTNNNFGPAAPVSFADSQPILITTTASLRELNIRNTAQDSVEITMDRFRPNIVIEDCDPWAEDYWNEIQIGSVKIDVRKPCDRCVVTTRNQSTGASFGNQPLKTLAMFRQSADDRVNGVLFGWNCAPITEGAIAVGEMVRVTQERPEGWPLKF